MEFRKMVMITLYAKQKKRHRCTEQTFGLWEKARVGCFQRTNLPFFIGPCDPRRCKPFSFAL